MNPPLANQGSQVPPLDIARLEGKAGQPWEVLVSQTEKDACHPLVMRTAYGMGEVTLVAFDLDQGRFTRGRTVRVLGQAPAPAERHGAG